MEDRLPNPDSFELHDELHDDEMAGSLGRHVEAQREDTGVHFEAGASGVLVEPQSSSREAVNQDHTQDFQQPSTQHEAFQQDYSYMDLNPEDTNDPSYRPSQIYLQDPMGLGDSAIRRSERIRKPSQAYLDSLASRSFFDSNVLQFLASSPDVLLKLFAAATSKEQYAPSKLKPTDKGFEPNGWKEAMACIERDKWLIAAHKELARHNKNGTWKIIPRTKAKGRKPLTLRWVFKIKYDGTYKARLVARGFRQIKDLDYHEVYAVVAKPMSFKIFTAIAASKGWLLHHVDIMTAFLYAELKEPIEIELPEGMQDEYPAADFIGLLQKTIYGLKQSPREWYRLLHDVLISIGFVRTQSDHSIFIKKHTDEYGDHSLYVMVYVDDLLVLSPSESAIQQFKSAISRHFDISDKGILERYLVINVIYGDHREIHLS
ncbi:hypothetical protein N7530_010469 [Penicillium desertorum]|uniref:Reverse transcriptase Ty1/copia-type domain-containing protein n=1 Tax=Penicillium desertorum TaxID=1303715 RepID=A0A9X0BHP2_9EURO|nr:hypothetical protein N7530_010469 [Penicillium desertorum]